MYIYEPDTAQNQTDYFFNFDCQKTLSQEGFWMEGDMEVRGYFLKKQALRAKLSKRGEAASSSYSAVDFLQYIYLVLVAKNH